MDLLVKELTAKINAAVYDQRLPHDAVETLVNRVENNPIDGTTFLDVYQLGFGNNPSAIPALGRLATHEDQYIRQAAMSFLGILRSIDHIDFFIGIQEDTDSWSDRAVAIKALGDIGTRETLDYLARLRDKLRNSRNKESSWNVEIIDLYLRDS
jgi:HEAT repeat protein